MAQRSGFDLEIFINRLLQRLFPAWYAVQAAKELPLQAMGPINPNSFCSRGWLNVEHALAACQSTLRDAGDEWQPLFALLGQLRITQSVRKSLAVSDLNGIQNSQYNDDWPNLMAYAEHTLGEQPWQSAEEFDLNLRTAFAAENAPFTVHYREWDGRYALANETDSAALSATLHHIYTKQRDHKIKVDLVVESINSAALEKLQQQYWMVLLKRETAYQVLDLLQRANLNALSAEFEPRRPDLVFLVAPKQNRSINRVMLSLMDQRSSQQIQDFGRYLLNHHFPIKNS